MNYPDDSEVIRKKFEPLLQSLGYNDLQILNNMVVNRMRMIRQAGTLMFMSKFNIGDRVSWIGTDGIKRTGIIIKMNQKTVSVKISTDGYWNISPELLSKE
jgi:hypothetical protein